MSTILPSGTMVHARYRIVRQIGKGGMGAVYLAIDETFASQVALKQMFPPPHLSPQQVTDLERAFRREAQLLHQLRHPALPRVSDYFVDAHGRFLVMDYIEGQDLATVLAHRQETTGTPLSEAEVLPWAIQVLTALEYLHTHTPPIIHRDIKPHNLKLTARGAIFLLDFGLARGTSPLTTMAGQPSMYAYTPAYAPLEQLQGTGMDARSDLYSLGATLYHLLSGHALDQPPRCDALTRAAAQVYNTPDPLVMPPGIPLALQQVLRQALALNAADRPPGAAAMRQALEEIPHQMGAVPGMRATIDQPHPAPTALPAVTSATLSPQPAGYTGETIRQFYPPAPLPQPAAYTSATILQSQQPLTPLYDLLPAIPPPPRPIHHVRQTRWLIALLLVLLLVPLVFSIYQYNTYQNRHSLPGLYGESHSQTLAFAPDGQTLALAHDQIQLWPVADRSLARTLDGSVGQAESVVFAPDGQTLAAAADDGTIGLWDVSDGTLRDTLEGHGRVVRLAFAPDGQTLAAAADDGTIRLWDVNDGTLRDTLEGHGRVVRLAFAPVGGLAFAPDGQTLAAGAYDGTIGLWDVSDGTLRDTLEGHGRVVRLAFAPDGQTLASAGEYDDTIRLWDVTDKALMLASAADAETIQMQDSADDTLWRSLTGHTRPVTDVVFAPDGQTLVSASHDETIRLWDVATGEQLDALTGHTTSVLRVAFILNGQKLVSVSRDGTVRQWELPAR